MVSRYVGIDNWPGRWDAARAALDKGVNWSEFRRNRKLMHGIQTDPAHAIRWAKKCDRVGVPPSVYEDSRFGNPKGMEHNEVFVTASSCRAAYHAWRIRSMWPGADMEPSKPVAGAVMRWMMMPSSMLEIGGGYGALVRAIALVVDTPLISVSLADAAPLQHIQKNFLHETTPLLHTLKSGVGDRYDLVTNTNSLGEMHVSEVERYLGLIQERLRPGGVFYTVNRRTRVTNFTSYPYDEKWHHRVNNWVDDRDWVECFSVRDPHAVSPHPSKL